MFSLQTEQSQKECRNHLLSVRKLNLQVRPYVPVRLALLTLYHCMEGQQYPLLHVALLHVDLKPH
jgi:hypothetical protein